MSIVFISARVLAHAQAIDLSSMFFSSFGDEDGARTRVEKGEQICQSLFAMLV